MLAMHFHLRFPRLVYVKRATTTHKNASVDEQVTLFRLDWDGFEKKKRETHEAWVTKCAASRPPAPFVDSLPKKYADEVAGAFFAVDDDYMVGIRHHARQSAIEWQEDGERPYDTLIRETCLTPAIAHVEVAFRLLADCRYDPKAKFFAGNWGPLLYAMLYGFWAHQTGCGLLRRHACFDEMVRWMESEQCDEKDDVAAFIAAIDEHETKLHAATKPVSLKRPRKT